MHARCLLIAAALLAWGCEDGPKQVFTPNSGEPLQQNGYVPTKPFVQGGEKKFDFSSGSGDSAGRAKFCDSARMTALVQEMVNKPILPDVSVAGVPLWNKQGGPVHANDLIGPPEEGKFCDPDVYADALVWGPNLEIVAFINQETKLVESIMVWREYLGKLEGTFTSAGVKIPVIAQSRFKLKIDGKELTEYAKASEQAAKPNSWLNHGNITKVHSMIRETFFGAAPSPAGFDCVAAKICDVIYTAAPEGPPQTTAVVFQDSGVVLAWTKDGFVTQLEFSPVRVAPFEAAGNIATAAVGGPGLAPKFTSSARPGCSIDLGTDQTFATFKSSCIEAADTRTLTRATYDVEAQRDAVEVQFNGINARFLRRIAKGEVLKDGERPGDGDKLYAFSVSRSLAAPVAQFVPSALGATYKTKLEARVRAIGAGTALATYTLAVPTLSTEPSRMTTITNEDSGEAWLPEVVADLQLQYGRLTAEQKELVGPAPLNPVFAVEPFVDAVLEAFTGGPVTGATKFFRTTDDRRWSIGRIHFRNAAGVPFRLEVQYSLNFGAVTFVSFSKGYSQIDEAVRTWGGLAGIQDYELAVAQVRPNVAQNRMAIGGDGLKVVGEDLKLGTVDVEISVRGMTAPTILTVPGSTISQRAGYSRQIRGERFEFVPAHQIALSGKETSFTFYVEEDGKIGRISQGTFKYRLLMCGDGIDPASSLYISYGDNVRAKVSAWAAQVGPETFSDCDVVYNYTANGNVLDSVVSIRNRISFTTVDGRAVGAAIWRQDQ